MADQAESRALAALSPAPMVANAVPHAVPGPIEPALQNVQPVPAPPTDSDESDSGQFRGWLKPAIIALGNVIFKFHLQHFIACVLELKLLLTPLTINPKP